MLRVVAYRKAILAGVLGAIVWEAALRPLALAGLPLFDVVWSLGTLAFPDGGAAQWWPVGMAAHAAVGAVWATFYAYFFWARFRWPPIVQGLVFAAFPAILATLIVVPQVGLMHVQRDVVQLDWRTLLAGLEPRTLAGILAGHVLFGLTVGTVYSRPVGYSVTKGMKKPRQRRPRHDSGKPARRESAGFMFSTGFECSYPTIGEGQWRRDQMAATRHYSLWRDDFQLARDMGVTHVRYGPPLHLILTGPGRFDWSWIDEPMRELAELGPEPIVDLCHFGVPTWLGNFQNDEIVPALAEYADAFARRYPHARLYTPINEMYVCARMSALEGTWNEQLKSEGAFVRAVVNMARASIAMTDAILAERPDALFVNSESSEFNQPCCPDERIRQVAAFENERRFLPLDLIYAHEVSPPVREYLREHGVTDEQYCRFMARKIPPRTVLGVDYYEWNERLITADARPQALGELFGWYVIANHYWERYRLTMMHTETNRMDAADGPRWLWRQWHNVQLLRAAGARIVGFTWYSLTDQIDWDRAVSEALGVVNPVGLFDLNRDPRSVGLSYKHLIDMHRDEPEYRECDALKKLLN